MAPPSEETNKQLRPTRLMGETERERERDPETEEQEEEEEEEEKKISFSTCEGGLVGVVRWVWLIIFPRRRPRLF